MFSLNRDGGLEYEGRYVDGLPDGLQQEWHANGQLAHRALAVRGRGSSESWSWHANGVMRFYRRDIDQRPVEVKAWDEAANPVDPATMNR